MRIQEITVFLLNHSLQQPIIWANGKIRHRNTLLVKITTQSGVTGWGETTNIYAASIIEKIGRLLIGKNATERNPLWHLMYSNFCNSNCNSGIVMRAISAIDIALWDITGKIHDEPVYNLLGGKFRSSIAAYASGMYMSDSNEIKNMRFEIEKYLNEGFQSLKMKIGALEISEEILRIYDCTENPFRDILFESSITPKNGYLEIPEDAGLGVNVDENAVKRYITETLIINGS